MLRVNSASKMQIHRLHRLTVGVSIGYALALIVIVTALRFIGEQWWVTTVLLYVPRIVFVTPLLPLTLCAIFLRNPRLVWMQVLSGALAIGLLAGFNLSIPHLAQGGSFSFRIASCNMATGAFAVEEIVRELQRQNADVIVLQESHANIQDRLAAAASGYSVRANGQFWIASRFPIDEVDEPAKLPFNGQLRSPRFIKYRLSTPRGAMLIYNVHFISPRDGIEELRGDGFRYELERGNLLSSRSREVIENNTSLRELQMRVVGGDASRSPYPAIIAGDTNLPGLSWAFSNWFGNYRDGFSEAGNGFGYTFPAPRHPWMRIDRILADGVFRFLSFDVVRKPLSDHFPVIAQVEWPAGD